MAVKDGDMEARIARLESDVAHMRSDIADMKSDIRTLRDRIDALSVDLNTKFAALKDELYSAKLWALLLYFALAGGMYATMARGFGWI
jgi:outer membrane murein-binding lipoprotein Lpp